MCNRILSKLKVFNIEVNKIIIIGSCTMFFLNLLEDCFASCSFNIFLNKR